MYKLILISLLFSFSTQAQDVWQDYIIGKPMPGFAESRQQVAQEWGIKYQAIFAGCVVDESIAQKMETYNKENEIYFEKITTRYGEGWQQVFNLEAAIARTQTKNVLEGRWIDVITEEQPDTDYYAKKGKLANQWGIDYLPLYINETSTVSATMQAKIDSGATYVRHLGTVLGNQWQAYFDMQLAQSTRTNENVMQGTWDEYLLEKVDESYYQRKKQVLANWGVAYEPHFVHCCKGKNKKMKNGGYAEKSAAFEAQMKKVYGDNWKQYLHIAIQKELKTIIK